LHIIDGIHPHSDRQGDIEDIDDVCKYTNGRLRDLAQNLYKRVELNGCDQSLCVIQLGYAP
jgi:hypothetical protein